MHEAPFFRIRISQVENAKFSKKSHFWGPNSVFPPFLAHFACAMDAGQKFPKMAFFAPKTRAIPQILSTVAYICGQTPFGTTGRPKTPILVKFWRFWPFSGFFACRRAIFAFLALFGPFRWHQIRPRFHKFYKFSWRRVGPVDGGG